MPDFNGYMRRRILALAWPVVLEMSWFMIVNLLVTAMVGRLGAVSLAAVGLATMVQFSSTMIFAAAGTGAAALVARASGAGDWPRVRLITGQAIVVSLCCGFLLTLIGWQLSAHVFGLVGAEEAVATLGGELLRIQFLSAPCLLLFSVGNAILRGIGKTRLTLLISFVAHSMNLSVSFLLINGIAVPTLGASGAAWGSCAAQTAGALAVFLVLFRQRSIRLRAKQMWPLRVNVMREILAISVPAGLEQLAMQGGRIVYTFLLAEIGAVQFAAHQIAMQVESISFLPGFAFSIAAMTLVGQNLGRSLSHRAEQYVWQTNRMALGSMTAMALIFFLFAEPLTRLFISDPDVVYWGSLCVKIAALEQPTIALTYVFAGALRGAGYTKWPMYITALGVWGVRIPVVYAALKIFHCDITAAWYITAADFLLRSLILWRRFRVGDWKRKELPQRD
ncbi:MATE family efflux transporter [Azotosporobacter soli]|uniref:MATE family efflux transporter n=1 Tax=Azotosporobacter soli TaxID=3055040 RepID=UPI0031FE9F53